MMGAWDVCTQAHVSHSTKLAKSPHMHVGCQSQLDLDSLSEFREEADAESFEHQKKKNLNFLNVHQVGHSKAAAAAAAPLLKYI